MFYIIEYEVKLKKFGHPINKKPLELLIPMASYLSRTYIHEILCKNVLLLVKILVRF